MTDDPAEVYGDDQLLDDLGAGRPCQPDGFIGLLVAWRIEVDRDPIHLFDIPPTTRRKTATAVAFRATTDKKELTMPDTPTDKAATTRFVHKMRKFMYADGGFRSAPERDGILHGTDVDYYDRKTRELRADLNAMSTEVRQHWMASAFPLPKPYDKLTEEEQATARLWDWEANPAGPPVTKTGRVLTDGDIEALAAEAERGYDINDK